MKNAKKPATKTSRMTGTPRTAVVTLKKMPDENALPAQAFAMLGVLKAKGGSLAVEELKKAMEGKVESKQAMAAVWAHYRKSLTEKGFIRMGVAK
jgi:hypothetical protein